MCYASIHQFLFLFRNFTFRSFVTYLYLLCADSHPSLKGPPMPPCPTTDGNNGEDMW